MDENALISDHSSLLNSLETFTTNKLRESVYPHCHSSITSTTSGIDFAGTHWQDEQRAIEAMDFLMLVVHGATNLPKRIRALDYKQSSHSHES
ncbi:hypothetical protein BHYA_0065g00270 [Botrytis hyacinthi]|uniref:Uncharacterized protein n=1 Tax=Botrytis hyacinthi TaxID=278943 RepID=A0A4Z1GUE7_9HELO|nr:hypothetical protein BHYA_0065g00270 [Botrytis hyacinthi]